MENGSRPGGGARAEDEVAASGRGDFGAAMSEMAQSLRQHHGDVEKTMTAISHAAVDNLPGADSAGISVQVGRRTIETKWEAGGTPGRVARIQSTLGEGPCLEAIDRRASVRIDDVSSESRWPRFTAELTGEPIGSMLSVPLLVADNSIGSLSVYSTRSGVFDAAAEEMGLILAGHAAVAIAGAQREEGLRLALDSRDLIGQAKGILMERHKIPSDQAFAILVQMSQRLNVKLRDLADTIARTGTAEPS